jgi:acid phosphatase
MHRRTALAVAAVAALAAAALPTVNVNARDRGPLRAIQHIVVIYEENHSFDNLYGGWEGVNGLKRASTARTLQVNAAGTRLQCLPQNDVNLTSPSPLPTTCTDTTTGTPLASAFTNRPFDIGAYISPTDATCPAKGVFAANGVLKGLGLPGGCTRDLVHRFYQEQYQIDGGRMDRYTAGSDAMGLTQGYYNTKSLPVYQYLHGPNAPRYAIADNFFQAAFGGSFLNHQWLIAAASPVYTNADHTGGPSDLHSIIGADGSPANYPLHPSSGLKDGALTVDTAADGTCPAPATICGDYAVNTIQPWYQPFSPGTADARRLPPQTGTTIGDELTAANVSWAWYSGGWSNANGDVGAPGWTNGSTVGTCTDPDHVTSAAYPNCPDKLFQFHHQPFNYYASFAPGTDQRAQHLRDEVEFITAAQSGNLPAVSFVKPLGAENEHPGYASETAGSSHLVDLLQAIENGPEASSTMVIVTYDEFGGQWDHVPPPTAPGVSDVWGPGTRIPALVVSPRLPEQFSVDHRSHDTTSILATIEHRFALNALTSRDASVVDLSTVFDDD